MGCHHPPSICTVWEPHQGQTNQRKLPNQNSLVVRAVRVGHVHKSEVGFGDDRRYLRVNSPSERSLCQQLRTRVERLLRARTRCVVLDPRRMRTVVQLTSEVSVSSLASSQTLNYIRSSSRAGVHYGASGFSMIGGSGYSDSGRNPSAGSVHRSVLKNVTPRSGSPPCVFHW